MEDEPTQEIGEEHPRARKPGRSLGTQESSVSRGRERLAEWKFSERLSKMGTGSC